MATGCAVSPAFTFHNRKTRATSPSPSPLSSCRAKLVGRVLNIIDAVARTHARIARTHAAGQVYVCTRECVQPAAAARTWTLRARRFIISRRAPGASVARQRHARARACVSESGARRRGTTHACVLTPHRCEYTPVILGDRRRRRRAGLFTVSHGFVVCRNVLPRIRLLVRSENRSGLISRVTNRSVYTGICNVKL